MKFGSAIKTVSTMLVFTEVEGSCHFLNPRRNCYNVSWFCFCGAVLHSYSEEFLAISGESHSSRRNSASYSVLQPYQHTHYISIWTVYSENKSWPVLRTAHRLKTKNLFEKSDLYLLPRHINSEVLGMWR